MELLCDAIPAKIDQPLSSTKGGHDSEADFGKSHDRVFRRHAKITRERQFEPASESKTVDGSNHRQWRMLDVIENPLTQDDEFARAGVVQLGHVRKVATRYECTTPPGNDKGSNVSPRLQRGNRVINRHQHGAVERVEGGRTSNGDLRDVVRDLKRYILVRQLIAPWESVPFQSTDHVLDQILL